MLFPAISAKVKCYFQLRWEQVISCSMKWWWCLLYTRPTCLLDFIVIAHWNNSPLADMLLHSHTLSWYQANQSLLLLPNVQCLKHGSSVISWNLIKIHLWCKSIVKTLHYFKECQESYCSLCTLDTCTIHRLFFVTRLIINKINKVQWVDFKLENVLISLHSLKTMGLGSIIFKEWRVT